MNARLSAMAALAMIGLDIDGLIERRKTIPFKLAANDSARTNRCLLRCRIFKQGGRIPAALMEHSH